MASQRVSAPIGVEPARRITPIGPQSSGSARRWLSFERELQVERFRVTLNGLGEFHMGNPGLKLAKLCPDTDLRSQIHEKTSALEQLTFQGEHILGMVDMAAQKRENRGFADMVEAARGEAP